jgi:ABC-2 type transport system permease protein
VNSRALPSRRWADVPAEYERAPPGAAHWLRRLRALVRKELRQILRDRSNLGVAVVLPLLLIIIIGCALSQEVTRVRVVLVMDDSSPAAYEAVAGLQLSRYFSVVPRESLHAAEQLMLTHGADAIVHVQEDFSRRLAAGRAPLQVLVQSADANRARIIQGYLQGALSQRSGVDASGVGSVVVQRRQWFNESNDSTQSLAAGLLMLVVTLIGTLLTALVMAREWERGTLEPLLVTPVRVPELLLAKLLPYFAIGLLGLALCLGSVRFIFGVPLRGSLGVLLLASALYLLTALGLGLSISSGVRNQFIASQLALLTSFMPSLMLSGFLFDLRSVPAVVRFISHLLPATYYVDVLRTLFLAGNVWPVIWEDCAALTVTAGLLLTLAAKITRKRLE